MDAERYERFTERLREGLAADERVLGLVALGSMARQDTQPDRWSDHDFLVIVRSGDQETFRQSLSWLPDAGDLVLSYRETTHGLKALYRDGHLLEFAVFDPEELHLAKVNRYRVLLDGGGIADAMSRIREESASWISTSGMGDFERFGQFLANLLVGAGRHARGEHLSGRQFLGYALQNLVVLLAKHVPKETDHPLDDLDPLRRFERVWPAWAASSRQPCRHRSRRGRGGFWRSPGGNWAGGWRGIRGRRWGWWSGRWGDSPHKGRHLNSPARERREREHQPIHSPRKGRHPPSRRLESPRGLR